MPRHKQGMLHRNASSSLTKNARVGVAAATFRQAGLGVERDTADQLVAYGSLFMLFITVPLIQRIATALTRQHGRLENGSLNVPKD